MNALVTYREKSGGKNPAGRRWRVVSSTLQVAILSFISCSLASAQTSAYHPFPDSNASWCILTGCLDGSCNGDYGYIVDRLMGDTIVDGMLYHKVQETYFPSSNNNCCTPPLGLGSGYLREDTANRKVYWRVDSMGQDTLLYDFSLQIGDTLNGLMGSCPIPWVVQTIDSTIVGSDYHKRINFDADTCNGFSIIEGIGSTQGLTNCPYSPFEMATILQCVTVADELVYSLVCGSALNPCEGLSNIISMPYVQRTSNVQVTPNPTTGLLRLDGPVGQAPFEVTVMDMAGQVVDKKMIPALPAIINVSSLSKGAYSLRIIQRDGNASHVKFIRQ